MSNYGENHFGVPVQEYFPWNKYTSNILEEPKINRYYTLYRQVIEFKISSIWRQSDGGFVTGGGGQFTNDSPSFFFDTYRKRLNSKYSVESWSDVEKLRLIEVLGIKESVDKYLSELDRINEIIRVIQDIEDCSEDDFGHLDNYFRLVRSSEVDIPLSDSEIISYVQNYEGNIDFYNSLKSYLNNNKTLTTRQIEAIRKNKPKDFREDKICLQVTTFLVDTFEPLMSNLGYTKITNGSSVYFY
jgi:hypothetical protein